VTRLACAALALLGLLLAGCSVGAEDRPHVADDARVPFGLLDPDTGREASPTTVAGAAGLVYLVDPDGRLVGVPRFDPSDGVDSAVAALVAPPTDDERAIGLDSALADDGQSTVRGATVESGRATVELGPGFLDLPPDSQRLAVAQVVVTLTGLPGVGQVQLTSDGEPLSVPVADGATVDGPVSRDDFASLLPS
jgi:spore germination protein GerM